VAIDAFYSTDGSVPNLRAYVELCEKYDCVMVLDEAHSFGIVGEKGGGLAVELGLQNRIPYRTASLSKALGGHGGFIVGTMKNIEYLRFRCRSILFSSSTAEIIGAGNCAALEVAMSDDARRRRCLDMAHVLRTELAKCGISAGDSMCQIVSITLSGSYSATRLYWALRERGVLASVFAYPATPKTRSLLRFSIHSEVTESDMKKTANLIAMSIRELDLEDKLTNKGPDGIIVEETTPCEWTSDHGLHAVPAAESAA
jgi:CAI-1 autoinducer synthase